MADGIVRNHTPKSETEKQGLLAKLHITNSSPGLSTDEEEKVKKDKTMKEKVEEKLEENKVKVNVKIIQGTETALNLKQKTAQQIGGGGNNEKKELAKESEEQKAKYDEEVVPEDKVPSGYNKAEDGHTAPPPQLAAAAAAETESKEKKGILEMIKEKLPGYPSKSEEEIKKEKECDKE